MARQLTQAAQAAKAIRKELKDKFPGVKFSVRSSNFAGGNSVDIAYDIHDKNTPNHRDVHDITIKYQYGNFDPMTDMYMYNNSHDEIPQAKYVHVSHRMGV